MSGLFSPDIPATPEPIKPPTTDDARQAEEDLTKLRRRKGRASTFLFGKTAKSGAASTALGAGSDGAVTTGAATATTGAGSGGGSRGGFTEVAAQ